jgi:hypothetical protein
MEIDHTKEIKPVLDDSGNSEAGYFAFDSLPDNPEIETEIRLFKLEEERKKKLKQIDESVS